MHSVLLDPLSPDQLHSNFSQAANGAAQAIKHFTQLVEDSRTKEVMENAQESRRQNSEGIVGWQVTEHEDWLDAKPGDGNDSVGKEEGVVAEAGDSASMDNVNVALDKFRSTHVGLEVSLDEGSRTVNVSYLRASMRTVLMYESSISLRQLRSISRSNSLTPLKAKTVSALIPKANQAFTKRFLRQSDNEPKRTI